MGGGWGGDGAGRRRGKGCGGWQVAHACLARLACCSRFGPPKPQLLPSTNPQVFIETVDSFQGKQLDVVILSCVRASTGGGLGERWAGVNGWAAAAAAAGAASRCRWWLGKL